MIPNLTMIAYLFFPSPLMEARGLGHFECLPFILS